MTGPSVAPPPGPSAALVACDRCLDKPAEVAVRCYLGCSHDQCAGCARQTQQDRDDELADDDRRGVIDPFCTSSHACQPGGEPVRCSRRASHDGLLHRCPKCFMRWTGAKQAKARQSQDTAQASADEASR